MPKIQSRQDYLRHNRRARAWAALDAATNQQMRVTHAHCLPKRDSLNGKRVVIVGTGVGGLATAYELLARNSDVKVILLEARDRVGGRCLTLRTGDTLTEDKDDALISTPGDTQVVRFDRPVGDSEPYLNAGPGRIPSSHRLLLDYLRRFGVEVEVYVMASGANLSQMSGGPEGDAPVVNRRLTHNTRGWIAEMVYGRAAELLGIGADPDPAEARRIGQLQSLMVTFGDLTEDGRYVVRANKPGEDDGGAGSDRAGYSKLQGVSPGVVADAIGLDALLESEFWRKTRVYQPLDYLWQPTLFQPVGGMDRVVHAFWQQVATLGGVTHLNSPVTRISYDAGCGQFVIEATGHAEPFLADYCFCNLAMPFLEGVLAPELQASDAETGLEAPFKAALHAVYAAQANENPTRRFLAPTTKVGWQADRTLWQGTPITTGEAHDHIGEVRVDRDSEVGVVPIYGGISWTDHSITQIWYPSDAYHDQRGVLTGCYNFGTDACRSGKLPVEDRLRDARAGAARFGEAFAAGLEKGVAIAWQNMAHIKGGWQQWAEVDDSVTHFNHVIQGSAVLIDDDVARGVTEKAPTFFIVGDQVSSLPGWQEGAIASALNAISRLARPDLKLPHLAVLPDPQLMVEGL